MTHQLTPLPTKEIPTTVSLDDCEIVVKCAQARRETQGSDPTGEEAMPEITDSEKVIKVTAKLYEARDYVRRMQTPEEFKNNMSNYQDYIREGMRRWNVDAIHSMMRLANGVSGDPIVQSGLFSAYVEMVEPSI